MVANTIKIFQKLTMEITILECKKLIKPKVDFFFFNDNRLLPKIKENNQFSFNFSFLIEVVVTKEEIIHTSIPGKGVTSDPVASIIFFVLTTSWVPSSFITVTWKYYH